MDSKKFLDFYQINNNSLLTIFCIDKCVAFLYVIFQIPDEYHLHRLRVWRAMADDVKNLER